MTTSLERRVLVIPAFEGPHETVGRGSMKITFAVVGPRGATSFTADLGIHLDPQYNRPPAGSDLSTHYRHRTKGPLGDYIHCEECSLTPEGEGCYLQASTLLAEPFWQALLRGGHEPLFDLLEDLHERRMGGTRG